MKLTDDSRMPFGKHQGTKLSEVPSSYLLWALDQQWVRQQWPPLIDYIRDNQDALEMDAAEERAERGEEDELRFGKD